MVRRVVLAAFLALGIVGSGTAAQAVPVNADAFTVTVGCDDGEGGFEALTVQPRGSMAFLVDEAGVATGEKLFLVSIDAAAFSDDGQLVGEFHQTYGKRTGHGEPVSCSGSYQEGPDVTVFFDILVTRR